MATRSRKSSTTLDREVSELEQARALAADLTLLNQELREKLAAANAENLRVQALLRITQVKLKDTSKAQEAKPIGASFKERCLAYFAATGARSVTSTELREWEAQAARPTSASYKERCRAYFDATGASSVTTTELREWEKENGHA